MIFQSSATSMVHSTLKNQQISKKFMEKYLKIFFINDIISVYYIGKSKGNEQLCDILIHQLPQANEPRELMKQR